jgi:hypothetical protein
LSGSVDAVIVDPAKPSTVYAARNGVFRSTDGGGSWTQLSSAGYPSGLETWTLALDPANRGSILAGTLGAGAFEGQFVGGPTLTSVEFIAPKKFVISGTGFGDSPTVKCNRVDVSGFIRGSSDTGISIRASPRIWGWVPGPTASRSSIRAEPARTYSH